MPARKTALPTTPVIQLPGPAQSSPPEERPAARSPKRKSAARAGRASPAAKADKIKRRKPATRAIALPAKDEPLVTPAPLPKNRALVPMREAGLLARAADWVGHRALALARRLASERTPRPTRAAPAKDLRQATELRLLRGEIASLRLQIAALAARHDTPAPPPRQRELALEETNG